MDDDHRGETPEQTFLRLKVEHHALIRLVAKRAGMPACEIPDLEQIVLAKLFLKLTDREPINDEQAWLYRVTRNAAMDYHRKNKRRIEDQGRREPLVESIWATNSHPNEAERIRDERIDQLRKAIEMCDPVDRMIVHLRFGEERREIKDIAERVGLSASAVNKRLKKMREKLKGELSSYSSRRAGRSL